MYGSNSLRRSTNAICGQPRPENGKRSECSAVYRAMAIPVCRRLDRQRAVYAFDLARLSAGRSRPARMAMIAITTNSSMRVKAVLGVERIRPLVAASERRLAPFIGVEFVI